MASRSSRSVAIVMGGLGAASVVGSIRGGHCRSGTAILVSCRPSAGSPGSTRRAAASPAQPRRRSARVGRPRRPHARCRAGAGADRSSTGRTSRAGSRSTRAARPRTPPAGWPGSGSRTQLVCVGRARRRPAGRSSRRSGRDGVIARAVRTGRAGPAGSACHGRHPTASGRSWPTGAPPTRSRRATCGPPGSRGVGRSSTCPPTRSSASRSGWPAARRSGWPATPAPLISLDLASIGPLLADGSGSRPERSSGRWRRTCCSRPRASSDGLLGGWAAGRTPGARARPGRGRQARRGRGHRPRPRRAAAPRLRRRDPADRGRRHDRRRRRVRCRLPRRVAGVPRGRPVADVALRRAAVAGNRVAARQVVGRAPELQLG